MKLESAIYPDGVLGVVRAEVNILDLGEYPLGTRVFDGDGVCRLLSGCGVLGKDNIGSMAWFDHNMSYSSRAISCHKTLGDAKQWVSDTVADVEKQYREWSSLKQVHVADLDESGGGEGDPDWDTLMKR